MKIILSLLILLIAGCSTNKALQPIYINDETDSFVEFTDDKALSANLAPLRKKALIPGTKEIRVWVGFGIVSPEDLLVLKIDQDERVTGQRIWVYKVEPENWKDEPEALEEYLDGIYYRCNIINKYQNIESCEVKNSEFYDWSKIYSRLLNLDIWTLPDESKLPKPEVIVLDGFSVVVELSDGVNYRAYSYSNPGFRKDEEANKASQMMNFIMALY